METNVNAVCGGGGAGSHDYRQLGVLREFGNIANGVSDEEFLNVMRRTPKLNRVKWHRILKCLRDRIQQGITEDWNSMWQDENISEKLETLEKQKEKYSDASRPKPSWRPQLANVNAQLKSTDAAILQRRKQILELEAKEYESRVAKLKNTIKPTRDYLRALQVEMHKCQKKNDDILKVVDELYNKHSEVVEEICPRKVDECDVRS